MTEHDKRNKKQLSSLLVELLEPKNFDKMTPEAQKKVLAMVARENPRLLKRRVIGKWW